jgi:hypothetical protein
MMILWIIEFLCYLRGFHLDPYPVVNPSGFLIQNCRCGAQLFTDFTPGPGVAVPFNPRWRTR